MRLRSFMGVLNAAHVLQHRQDPGRLAWVTETPDPNKCGCRNLRCCKDWTPAGSLLGYCRHEVLYADGSTTASHAASMNGVVLKRVGTWSPDKREINLAAVRPLIPRGPSDCWLDPRNCVALGASLYQESIRRQLLIPLSDRNY